MRKVLIICDLFPPSFGPRMGYLCKYLPLYGWQPVVLTETVKDEHAFTFLRGETPVTYVDFYPEGESTTKGKWFLTFLKDFFWSYKDKEIYKKAIKILENESFDLILCSTFRTFPLQAAYKAAHTYKLPFVADLRDIIEQYTGYEYISHTLPSWGGLEKIVAWLFKKRNLQIRNRILRNASYITTISPWHVEKLKQFNSNTKLIYNGYDPELFYPETISTPQFTVTYTGRLLSTGMRDPSLFMEALSKLSGEQILTPHNCRVDWYVDESSWKIISREAEKYGVLSFMHFKGYVPAPQIPKVLNSSSVLLLLTNKATGNGPKGIMTTKLFESFAVGKPILCVRSDESYLEAMINKTETGLAARTVEETYSFLLHHFNRWKEKGYTTMQSNKEAIDSFSRKKQTEQFVSIFARLTATTQTQHG